MSQYVVTLEEDENGDTLFQLPKELLEGDNPWVEGDLIEYEVLEDGLHIINKSWIERNKYLPK